MAARYPLFLRRLAAPGAEAFAALSALETATRSLLVAVLPLQALSLTGDAQGVSTMFFMASSVGLIGGLCVPMIVRHTARRVVYTGGLVMIMFAVVLMAQDALPVFAAGMMMRAVAVATLTICLNLYIMDFVARRDFTRSEPMRLFYAAGVWMAGPVSGVWLGTHVHPAAPYAAAGVMGVACLSYFWFLRLTDNPSLRQPVHKTPSPLVNIPRFMAQPRLRAAWLLACGRGVWWVVFFIYVPIYAVEAGLGEVAGGAIVSCGAGLLFLMPVLSPLSRRFGIRAMFLVGYTGAAIACFAIVAMWGAPWLGVALIMCATLSMVVVDTGGNVAFLLSVHPGERPEMTSVYSTYRDISETGPPGLFSLILRVAELPAVFLTCGVALLASTVLASRLHPRLGQVRAYRLMRTRAATAGPVPGPERE
jgi:ACDE family multidrug resistance protein